MAGQAARAGVPAARRRAAARARFLDVSLPDEAALAEVQRLAENLVAMHDLLRDRRAVSVGS